MHLHLIGLVVAIAWAIRAIGGAIAPGLEQSGRWQLRWYRALVLFALPPLLILMTAVAILAMGPKSAHHWDGWLSYGLSLGFLAVAAVAWGQLYWVASSARREARRHPRRVLQAGFGAVTGRVMDISAVFSAQIGLWSSELVISQGLLDHLDAEHLAAVLAHESGHARYRDTFFFFLLGGLRRLTGWLPYTETLWQELMLLREIRADSWAVGSVDALVLAESLMSVITAPLVDAEAICAGFSCAAPRSRLAQRIDALLDVDEVAEPTAPGARWQWSVMALALSPLLAIPFHH